MFLHVLDSSSWLKDAIIIVISPLVALMKDQVNRLQRLKQRYGSERQRRVYLCIYVARIKPLKRTMEVYARKESLSRKINWNCRGKAHCIVNWGRSSSNKKNTAFRIWYSRLNELKSLVGKNVSFLALTVKATKQTKRQIFEMLELDNPFEIVDDPNCPNITFVVQKMDYSFKLADHCLFLVDELKQKGRETTRTIVYCQTIKRCAILFNIFKIKLGNNLFCDGTINPKMRLCGMMHSTSPDSVKDQILKQFSDGNGH